MNVERKIELKDVCKTIKGNVVLDRIEYTFRGGKIYGLQGHNGSGKTMLLRAICGLIHVQGEVIHDGKHIGKDIEFPWNTGLLLEKPAFLGEYSGYENLRQLLFIRGMISDKKIRTSLEAVGLDPDDRKTYRKYSLGMKQRLGIAGAIMSEPDLLILDEPTNALDPEGIECVKKILQNMKNESRIIIITSHDKGVLDLLADETIQMKDGRLINL